MKAADYFAKKHARKAHVRNVRLYGAARPFSKPSPGPGPRVEVNTTNTLVMSGTTDDIDTPEKRDSIARSILSHFGVDLDAELDRS